MNLVYHDLGRLEYAAAAAMQERLVRQVQSTGGREGYLLLVEHDPPVITMGRRASNKHILAEPGQLTQAGIKVHHAQRGGDVTYHGPGQLVGYPIVALRGLGLSLRQYVHGLEEVLIRVLGVFDIAGSRRAGLTGVWIGQAKIAAIGVAVNRWTCWHGFALNVRPAMEHFDLIVPCGLSGGRVTSMHGLLGRDIGVAEVKAPLVRCMAEVFGVTISGGIGELQ